MVSETNYLLFGKSIWIMEDNVSFYKVKIVIEEYKWCGGRVIDWLVNSLDLNPIENIWRLLKARVAK
jgi:hypothetical protein